jgi:hypothetical protein
MTAPIGTDGLVFLIVQGVRFRQQIRIDAEPIGRAL